LSDDDIAQMVSDAEANREVDEQRRERVALQNQADGAIYSVERKLRERGETVAPELREEIDFHIGALRRTLDGDDLALIRERIGELAAAAAQLDAGTDEGTGAEGAPGQQGTEDGAQGTGGEDREQPRGQRTADGEQGTDGSEGPEGRRPRDEEVTEDEVGA
jgi:molecular chaperone DnaK